MIQNWYFPYKNGVILILETVECRQPCVAEQAECVGQEKKLYSVLLCVHESPIQIKL